MRTLLLQLDTARHPSVFDRVVALDGGADEVMSYGGVTTDTVRDLVHGTIFTRGPKDLHHTAIFIGGTDMVAGEQLLAAVRAAFFGPLRVSVMLDSNGSNTTAVAAVVKLQQAASDVRGRRAVVTAATGPVGMRAAGLLALAGAEVVGTSRRIEQATQAAERIQQRFGAAIRPLAMADASQAAAVLEGTEILLNAAGAGIRMVPREAWAGRAGLRAAADVNAVPPLGIGALGVGNLKMKIHKACIARLFERNDLVLDAETIADVARKLTLPPG